VENRSLKAGTVFLIQVLTVEDVDQLNQILNVCGTPLDETLARIGSARAQMYIKSLPKMPKIPFVTMFPDASPAGTKCPFLHP
jgi:hypothetical protein